MKLFSASRHEELHFYIPSEFLSLHPLSIASNSESLPGEITLLLGVKSRLMTHEKVAVGVRWHKSCDPTWQLPAWLLRWLRKMRAASLATWLLCITVCRCEGEVERDGERERTLNPECRSVWSNFRRPVSLVLPRQNSALIRIQQ